MALCLPNEGLNLASAVGSWAASRKFCMAVVVVVTVGRAGRKVEGEASAPAGCHPVAPTGPDEIDASLEGAAILVAAEKSVRPDAVGSLGSAAEFETAAP